jgi:hypothetical protein
VCGHIARFVILFETSNDVDPVRNFSFVVSFDYHFCRSYSDGTRRYQGTTLPHLDRERVDTNRFTITLSINKTSYFSQICASPLSQSRSLMDQSALYPFTATSMQGKGRQRSEATCHSVRASKCKREKESGIQKSLCQEFAAHCTHLRFITVKIHVHAR